MKILVINPGSTSTKIAVYDDENLVFGKTLRHSTAELAPYQTVYDQYAFREHVIRTELDNAGIDLTSLSAIIGRGGMLKPIPSGVYPINKLMTEHLIKGFSGQHASNLGGLLADRLAATLPDCRSFIADPVSVDELQDVARVSGLPQIPRTSIFHALNQKAVAKAYAKGIGCRYEDLDLIVVHLGGGISVGAHHKGKVIEVNQALDGEGPIAPERAGTLPAMAIARLCFSGDYTLEQIAKMLNGKGGMVAHLGTNSFIEVEQRAINGDEKAILVFNAMAYSVAKYIGIAAVALCGKAQAILFTGGIAHSKPFVELIQAQVNFLAPCFTFPGEDEMDALMRNALSVMRGEEEPKEYI